MIDTFKAKTKTKRLYVKNTGLMTMIAEYQGQNKKPKLIDVAMGNFNGIVNDLRGQGYQVEIIK